MNTSIPPSFQTFVDRSLANGWATDESELMVLALSALEEIADYHEGIQNRIDLSLLQFKLGETVPMNMQEIKEQLVSELDQSGNPKKA